MLEQGSIDVDGVRRTYWLAPGPAPRAPLIIAFHAFGIMGTGMAAFSGLATRGPEAGFAVAFPDGMHKAWDDGRWGCPRPGSTIDDPGFIRALFGTLVAQGVSSDAPPTVTGFSLGAYVAEYLARWALLPVSTLGLIVGTAAHQSRQACPVPLQAARVLCFAGNGDPTLPYEGGLSTVAGPLGVLIQHRTALGRGRPVARMSVGAETVARDWAEANGIHAAPRVEALPHPAGDLPVTRLRWSSPGRPGVDLYRIEGGGHGWPGGPVALPIPLFGRMVHHLDATGLLLERAGARAERSRKTFAHTPA